jgi:hypothetical protein
MDIDEKVKLICKDNQYLLDEIEVKEIIKCWKKDRDFLIKIKEVLITILKE